METWTPTLSIAETDSGCRLTLHDYVYGEGPTLQEAADQLVARVLDAAYALRKWGGAYFRPQFAPVDKEWIAYLQDLAALAAEGGDARACVLGHP